MILPPNDSQQSLDMTGVVDLCLHIANRIFMRTRSHRRPAMMAIYSGGHAASAYGTRAFLRSSSSGTRGWA